MAEDYAGRTVVVTAGAELEQGGDAIVNTGSVVGLLGGRAGPAYVASKFGLIG
jgi:NAD(P)-dependent dehydrogenase (short-subunit alcohol dehydrogenase family)